MVYVIKANQEREIFNKQKVYRTCIRSGVPKNIAENIANEVESKVYDGITTKEILHIVLKKLDNYEKHHSLRYDLKKAISDLNPENHEFEKYVQNILIANGYNARWNVIVQGEVIEHQIDVIAEKDGHKYLVECKHHVNPHRFCGLDVALQTWAVIDDIRRGYEKGITKEKYDNMWLIINTKFSEHAIKYGTAKKLKMTGWNYPKGEDLRDYIETKGMYPITLLGLDRDSRQKFSDADILLVREIAETPLDVLYEKTHIRRRRLQQIINLAKGIIEK